MSSKKADHAVLNRKHAPSGEPRVLDFEAVTVPVSELRQHPRNPNRGDVAAIGESIARTGVYRPIVVSSDGVVLAGHHLVKAAREQGLAAVPVHRLLEVRGDSAEARRIMLADNQTAKRGRYDEALLAELLGEVKGDQDDLLGTGFTEADLAKLLGEFGPAGEDDQGRLDQIRTVTCPGCGHEFAPTAGRRGR